MAATVVAKNGMGDRKTQIIVFLTIYYKRNVKQNIPSMRQTQVIESV